MASLEGFEQRLEAVCSKLSFVTNVFLFAATETSRLWRVMLKDESFVDVYYSQVTGRVSFAHIRNEKRVFGADNAGEWHWHPREDPGAHIPCASEVTIEEFMKELGSSIK